MTTSTEINAEQIDEFLNGIRLISENQREILFGTDEDAVTTTQGHILMLLAQNGPQTNRQLADALGVTAAAVTKAIKLLQVGTNVNVIPLADESDGRLVRWMITEVGRKIAADHAHRHQQTVHEYRKILTEYTEDQQAIIINFIHQLAAKLQQEN